MKYEFGINDFENSVFSNQNAEKKTISAKKTIEFSDSRSRYCKKPLCIRYSRYCLCSVRQSETRRKARIRRGYTL